MNELPINNELLEQRKRLLEKNVIFTETDEDTLRKLAALFKESEVESGVNIVRKNEPSSAIYIILNGTVRIHDGAHVFGMMEDGAIFGEYSLLDTMPRSASVTTITKCRILRLDNEELSKNKTLRDTVIHGIVKVLTKRLREHNELEEKLTTAFTKIRLSKLQLEQEKRKIEEQNIRIKVLNQEITESRDEISDQNKQLKKEKKIIEQQNAEILQKNEEIRVQKEELERQRDQLAKEKGLIEQQNAEILLKNEEILAQNEEIRAQRDELELQRAELQKQKDALEKRST